MYKLLIIIFTSFILLYFTLKDKVYNHTLIFGTSLPKSGIMQDWGRSVEIGTNAYFKYVNENNILPNGEKIELVSLDDKYEPNLTIENTKKLLERENLFGFYGYVGTPTVKKILPLVENKSIPFIAPFTGASFLRDTNKEYFLNFRASYLQEINKIVDYLKNKKGIEKFAVFYQNDDFGEEGYVSLIKSLRSKGLSLNGEGMYKRNTLSIKHAFSEIRDKKPEAIIMIGAYKANALFIKKAKKDPNLKDVIFCNISFGDANQMIKELDYQTENLIFSQVIPGFDNFKVDVIKEYRYMMGRYYPDAPLGFISLESFLVAKSVVTAIKNIKGDITQEKFMEEFKKLPQDTLKGIPINYKNTQLLNKIYLFKYEDSRFKEIEYEN